MPIHRVAITAEYFRRLASEHDDELTTLAIKAAKVARDESRDVILSTAFAHDDEVENIIAALERLQDHLEAPESVPSPSHHPSQTACYNLQLFIADQVVREQLNKNQLYANQSILAYQYVEQSTGDPSLEASLLYDGE